MIFKQNEGTAARRRMFLMLVDAVDGITAETGEAAGQPQFSKNGAAWANTTATLTAVGSGTYYVELTAAELDTLGTVAVRYKSAATAEFSDWANVVAHDPFDAVSLGLSAVNANVVAGGITAASFAANAITSGAIASGALWTSSMSLGLIQRIVLDFLTRDWVGVTGVSARCVLNALRLLRNKWSISGTTLTVTEEDDTTTAWTGVAGTTAGALPITSIDPN
jgi:hypothetical protein